METSGSDETGESCNRSFYDALAPYYRFIYPDWSKSIVRQASQLDSVIRERWGEEVSTVLDASCGVGTQSLGLAQVGYEVTGSTLSAKEIDEAEREAGEWGLAITWRVADMRDLWRVHQEQFDLVISCDNAVPHLLCDEEILTALREFYRCLRPGGGCIVSIRDYAHLERAGRWLLNPRLVHEALGGRVVLFDVWEFEGDQYTVTLYLVEDRGDDVAETHVMRGRYYCVTLDKLHRLMRAAGFIQVQVLRDRFFQPLVVGSKETST